MLQNSCVPLCITLILYNIDKGNPSLRIPSWPSLCILFHCFIWKGWKKKFIKHTVAAEAYIKIQKEQISIRRVCRTNLPIGEGVSALKIMQNHGFKHQPQLLMGKYDRVLGLTHLWPNDQTSRFLFSSFSQAKKFSGLFLHDFLGSCVYTETLQ